MFIEYINRIKQSFKNELPGEAAQNLMTPSTRKLENITVSSDSFVSSSILILLFPYNGKVGTVLFKRNAYKGVHSAQVSFPGGKFEEDDSSLEYTALREANEEIGVVIDDVKIIGELTKLYIPPSNFMVYPFVGYLNYTPTFVGDKEEVDEIIITDLDSFFNPTKIIDKVFDVGGGRSIKAPAFLIGNHVIWGATAMIISELKELIKRDI